MRVLPKLQQLQVFQAVILHGSIRAAAKALDQSQPGITRSLQELEQTLGTPLVIRGGGGVMPTEAGIMFHTRMELVLNELNRTLDEIEHLNNLTSGTVGVGLSSLPILTLFSAALGKFRKIHPNSNVFTMEGQTNVLLPSLRSGKLDFIIGTAVPSEYLSGLVQEPLFKTTYRVYARKGHPLSRCTSLSQLQDADWYLPVTTMGQYNPLELLLFNSPNKAVMRGTGTAALQMVLHADFLTVVPKAMVRAHFLAQNLSIIPVNETLPDAEFSLTYSSERPITQAAKSLMDRFRWESQHYPWD
ncbi:LysR substrate-binding domain-containing protein [Edaphovirga cremea]|uniref:LysR substrate-binding domain-containing protein n=1 Tax=Edaphovirga cremea TaxID=2267246 RepID=UPI000DEF4B9F|nr:LysR substrate-binding domain-containing protein [Edaphovirga cremea]